MLSSSPELSIGYTPLVRMSDLNIMTKLECDNPSGSHYDRAYFEILTILAERGHIRLGDELRDITSGSAGRSLAFIGQTLGFKATITVPSELPEARIQAIKQYGARVNITHGDYIQGASEYQRQEIISLIKDPDWERIKHQDQDHNAIIFENKKGERICYPNHSEDLLTVHAFAKIGQEIIAQCQTEPAAIALAIGNWTTIAGIVPELRAQWPSIKVIGYQSAPGDSFENFGTGADGLGGTDVHFQFKDPSLLDTIQIVTNAERDEMARNIFSASYPLDKKLGRSSLMGLVVANSTRELGTIVTLAYDYADMY